MVGIKLRKRGTRKECEMKLNEGSGRILWAVKVATRWKKLESSLRREK